MQSAISQKDPPRAIILAAGQGSRLMPITKDIPKCLVPIAGRSFLERALGALLKSGIPKIEIITGVHADKVEQFVERHFPDAPIDCLFNPRHSTHNNFVSLQIALEKNRQSFLLMDGDLLFDSALLDLLLKHPTPNAMVVDSGKAFTPEAMKAVCDEENKIEKLGKNFSADISHGEYIGLAKFSDRWAGALAAVEAEPAWYYEDAIRSLIPTQEAIATVETGGLFWAEVDTREDLDQLSLAMAPE